MAFDFAQLLEATQDTHPMVGFDPKWQNPTDYILGITYEIWEQRQIDVINQTYATDVRVQSPAACVRGADTVISATEATLVEFPDRQNLGEDVIWSDDGEGGFMSSHRILSTATHAGDGQFGPATGRKLTYRVIADCATRQNLIYDEWLLRDFGAIVRQLGQTPRDYAQSLLQGGHEPLVVDNAGSETSLGTYRSTGNEHPAGEAYASVIAAALAADKGGIASGYDRAVTSALPGGSIVHGHEPVAAFWSGLRAAFPTAELSVVHQIGRWDLGGRPRAALRWTLHGRHEGDGMFGPPTGAEVQVLGFCHAEFGPRGVFAEWVLIDEVAIWQQILLGS